MQRNIILILFFLVTIKLISTKVLIPIEFKIQSEYRKDSIDFNEIEKTFYKERLSVLFSKESRFNITYVFTDKDRVERYTYNLILEDISPHTSLIIGNYYVKFGFGLLVGKKRPYIPDILSPRMKIASNKSTVPCNSGNPVFAFHGISVLLNQEISGIEIFFNSFYSIKERFIDQNSYNSSNIESSLETIDYKYDNDYKNNEPLDIHTHGSILTIQTMHSFLFQTYYLYTNLQSINKDNILWDYQAEGNESYGTSKLTGSGFFVQYKDNFLNFFFEGCFTDREISKQIDGTEKNDQREDIYGYGFLYGLRFMPDVFSISFIGKEVDSKFYSPYSSSIGEDYPERGWFLEAEVKPFRNLTFVTSLSSQKKSTVTTSSDDELPAIQREEVFLYYSYTFLKKLDIGVRKMKKKSKEDEKKIQFKGSAKFEISKKIMFKLYNIYQKMSDKNPSNIVGSGIMISILKNLKTNIEYMKGYISKSNAIYLIASPIQNSSIPGFFIRKKSDIFIFKLRYKYKRINLSLRYFYQFTRKKSLHNILEFFGSSFF